MSSVWTAAPPARVRGVVEHEHEDGSRCLAAFAAPPGLAIPARDLRRREARDVVVYLAQQGTFALMPDRSPLRFDGSCRLVRPTPDTRIAIRPAVIDGVRFVSRNNARLAVITNLDVRMVVALYRLAHMLRTGWGVSEIHHMGIGAGRGSADDCHNTGRAIDFAGVVGSRNGEPYSLDVLRDWGQQPIRLPGGRVVRRWPANARPTFRLDPVTQPVAAPFFRDLYEFATREFTDTSPHRLGNTRTSVIGGRSFICHPDHPAESIRNSHQNHLHMQIGPTRGETNPP